MSKNLQFDYLPSGYYTVGLTSNSCGNSLNYNVEVFSSSTPVHLYDGNTKVSHEMTTEYIPSSESESESTVVLSSDSESETEGGGTCVDGSGTDSGGDGCSWYTANPKGCGGFFDTSSFAAAS